MNRFFSFSLILSLLVTVGCVSVPQTPYVPDVDLVEERTPKEELTTTVLVPMPVLVAADSGDLKFCLTFTGGAVGWIKPGAPPQAEDGKRTGKPSETAARDQVFRGPVDWEMPCQTLARSREWSGNFTQFQPCFGETAILHMRPCLQTLVLVGIVAVQVSGTLGEATYWSLKAYDFQPGRYRVAGKSLSYERLTTNKFAYKFDVWLERERSNGVFERVATFVKTDDPLRGISRKKRTK